MTTVKVQRTEEIVVTADNIKDVLSGEWCRRYADRPFVEGDHVEFIREGRARHFEALGDAHIGTRGIVTALSDNGQDVKVLVITAGGAFDELWTPEGCLEGLGENAV